MFHLRWLPMYNSLLGSSRLSLVRESLGLGIGLEEHQARFVGQGARTGGVLSTDQKFASKEIREQLREEWQRLQAGRATRARPRSWAGPEMAGSRPLDGR